MRIGKGTLHILGPGIYLVIYDLFPYKEELRSCARQQSTLESISTKASHLEPSVGIPAPSLTSEITWECYINLYELQFPPPIGI